MSAPQNQTVRDALFQSPLFAGLTDEDYANLAQGWELVELATDAYLMTQGEASTDVFLVIKGSLDIYIDNGVDRRTVFQTAGPGDLIGELSALDNQLRSADVLSTTPCTLARISSDRFLALLPAYPSVSFRLLQYMAQVVRQLSHRVAAIAHQSCGQRLRELLMQGAQRCRDGHLSIPRQWSQSQLAELVGVRRESINRHLQAWRKAGLLNFDQNKYIVLDEQAWRAAVNRPA